MPQVSVIIPTRDRPDFLAEAIASVLLQTQSDLELIVVNDGEHLPFLTQDHRVKRLDNHGRGAVSARNLGLAQASGNYIAFLDDDDTWTDPNHLQDAIRACEAGADFVFADGVMQFPAEASPRLFNRNATRESLASDNTILVSAICYRQSLHRALGIFDEALPYYWDWDWYLRVARSGAVLRHLEKSAVNIRIHAQNMSGESTRAARAANLAALASKHQLGPLTLKNHTDFV
jgi:glycosyltransferase involved in cell wall biosynthesis